MQKSDAIVRPLLDWFAANARDLPWRRATNPYAIWISEIMLQQTQVKTVIPYWQRWMKVFPNVEALAAAPLDRVLKLWEGLGYYTRARHLHRAAQVIVHERAGTFPSQFEDVLALPGIGRYTAGAICSIAFNQPTPVLDGNVVRVLTRLFAIESDPRKKKTSGLLWQRAETLVRRAALHQVDGTANCSHLNQALMELGATICTAREPNCKLCPVRPRCFAFKQRRVTDFPKLTPRPRHTIRHFVAFALCARRRYLVRRRPAGIVNGGLWEFPNVEVRNGKFDPGEIARECLALARRDLEPLGTIKHTITRHRITLHVFTASTDAGPRVDRRFGSWRTLEQLEELAFPSAHRKIVHRLAMQRRAIRS